LAAAQALRLGLALIAASGCQSPRLPLTEALLGQAGGRAALEPVVTEVEGALRAGGRPAVVVPQVLFGKLGFQREVDDPDLRFQRLGSVLASRRGSCYGLGALVLALAERLGPRYGFSAAAVMVPGHLFVRMTDGGGVSNVELLRRGELMPEGWYRQKYAVPAGVREYLRPLSRAELLAVFDYNRGNDLRLRGRLAEAAAAYAGAAAAFPELAEAHASLGLVRHLLGALPEALRAYRAARAVNPALPGLDHNIEVVEKELAAAP
jgi:tetratricopeptide (TPR) repeat protein